jgi:flagellar basal-body rod protein FlgB
MPLSLDAYLGIHTAALKVQSQRMEVLADNLANADTPNFKARDVDFRTALAEAGAPGTTLALATTDANHLSTSSASGSPAALKYRVPLAPSLDGNTVDTQLEQAAFAENTVRYQATLTFLGARLKDLMTAITGQS